MWSFEDYCSRQGRPSDSKPSLPREYSHSPPRTPEEPTHTPLGFLVHGTPGVHDSESYFALPVTSMPSESAPIMTTAYGVVTTSPDIDRELPNVPTVDAAVLDLWTAFEKSLKDDGESSCLVAEPASPTQSSVTSDGVRGVPEISKPSSDKLSVPNKLSASSDPLHSSRSSPTRIRSSSASKHTRSQNVLDPAKSMFGNAKASSVQIYQSLIKSLDIDILNEETGEVYIRGVSLDMLKYFCGSTTISALLSSNTIRVPPTYASRDGIVRVIRYMRRCSQGPSRRPAGELHTPPSIKEGIATSLACRFFHLDTDAEHLERLVVQDFMGSPRFFITDEDVELIWCGYGQALRDTSFSDALVWFVLEYVMSGTHALADEVRWLLEQEEYEGLKARVRYELKKAEWRGMERKAFLVRCRKDREHEVAVEEPDAA